MQQLVKPEDLEWCPNCGTLYLGKISQSPSYAPSHCQHVNKMGVFAPGRITIEVPKTNGKNEKIGGLKMGIPCSICGTEMERQQGCGICPECGESGSCA